VCSRIKQETKKNSRRTYKKLKVKRTAELPKKILLTKKNEGVRPHKKNLGGKDEESSRSYGADNREGRCKELHWVKRTFDKGFVN